MIRRRDLIGFEAQFHRNGIAGESFYVCRFTMRHGKERHCMQAIVFDAPNHIAVTGPDWLTRYRGDYFEQILRYAIAQQNEKKPQAAHLHV